MNIKNQALVGCHVSIAGGFFKAIQEGMEIGCTAVQIFTKSNRSWSAKPITEHDAQEFITAQKNSSIAMVVAHASYLINLGSSNFDVVEKSYAALVDEIKRCQTLQIPYLVLHPGTSEPGKTRHTAAKTGEYINKALQATPESSTTVLVETMAGQGNSIGSSFQELAEILNVVTEKNRIGICFDTCHAFASGYDFTTQSNYATTFKLFDNTIGLQYLKMFHINDSKKELNSRVDRHENIGSGSIRLRAFEMIMNDPAFATIPKILETPKGDGLENDKKNLAKLISLIQ